MPTQQEVAEGYVVDLACVRKYPRSELLGRAKVHTRECALMPHCVESGYGIVDDAGQMTVLDSHATLRIYEVLRDCRGDRGIRLRVERGMHDGEMQTEKVTVL